ncbi:MAG: ABC transporter substrate-binding protein [Rhodobacterales bacterium]|nr:ABC transporter substrate-binding protein [Rhodobacterales bacterium]
MLTMTLKGAIRGGIAALALISAAGFAAAQDVADVPRNQTLVLTPWGDQPAQFANIENWNPYLTSITKQRDVMQFTVNEMLFYTNLNTGELIPWQGESFSYSDDFMSATIKLRDGVTWADGTPFTSADVKFTLEAVRDAPPEINGSAAFNEWVASVDAPDPLTAVIAFKKPAPRFVRDYMALGHENHYPILPAHIWQGQDMAAFTNYDPAAGLPMGTGAYRLVATSTGQQIFDRRDDWWGVTSGFEDAPAPARIILTPVSSDEAMGQLHIANQVDGGRQLLIGTFEAARAQNPNLVSWNAEGPVWGAPDGCMYSIFFNNMVEPWNDVNLRRAVNSAMDRNALADIAYEGAMPTSTFAFSGYMAGTWLTPDSPLTAMLDSYNVDNPSQEDVDAHMAAGGYERDAEGFWAKDGERIDFLVRTPAFIQPLLAPITQQLIDAGFDARQGAVDDTWLPDMQLGNFGTMLFVHCGSLSEPVETLQHYHSKWARPIGTAIPNLIAGFRYENPEMDAIIDRMEAIPASTDPASPYMQDAVAALDIALRDMPLIHLIEEYHVVTFNSTYWSGWPNAEDPYVAPYTPWEAFSLVIHNLKPTGN